MVRTLKVEHCCYMFGKLWKLTFEKYFTVLMLYYCLAIIKMEMWKYSRWLYLINKGENQVNTKHNNNNVSCKILRNIFHMYYSYCIFITTLGSWFLLYWLCQRLWLYGSQQNVENSSRDGNTRPPDLPLEKPVCKSGSNS